MTSHHENHKPVYLNINAFPTSATVHQSCIYLQKYLNGDYMRTKDNRNWVKFDTISQVKVYVESHKVRYIQFCRHCFKD
jgi:hypothetical protein